MITFSQSLILGAFLIITQATSITASQDNSQNEYYSANDPSNTTSADQSTTDAQTTDVTTDVSTADMTSDVTTSDVTSDGTSMMTNINTGSTVPGTTPKDDFNEHGGCLYFFMLSKCNYISGQFRMFAFHKHQRCLQSKEY